MFLKDQNLTYWLTTIQTPWFTTSFSNSSQFSAVEPLCSQFLLSGMFSLQPFTCLAAHHRSSLSSVVVFFERLLWKGNSSVPGTCSSERFVIILWSTESLPCATSTLHEGHPAHLFMCLVLSFSFQNRQSIRAEKNLSDFCVILNLVTATVNSTCIVLTLNEMVFVE